MVFLKKITRIDIKKNGNLIKCFESIITEDSCLISDGDKKNDQVWYLLNGNFEAKSDELKRRYPNLVDSNRNFQVSIAIPDSNNVKGLFYVTLPTQHEVALPFCINADFYPASDRKRIVLESDYQSEWNRAAIKAAAEVLRNELVGLRSKLSHTRIWEIINSCYLLFQNAAKQHTDASLLEFWKELQPKIRNMPIIFTTTKEWCLPQNSRLFEKEEEGVATELFEKMSIRIVHPDLRSFFTLLRLQDVGVPYLDIPDLTQALIRSGLNKKTTHSDAPHYFQEEHNRKILWNELSLLLNRPRKPEEKISVEKDLAKCAIAPGNDK